MSDRPSGVHVGPESAKASFVMLAIAPLFRLTVKMSPVASFSAANATCVPSGEKLGDSGSSTVFISMRCSILPVSTFWTISVRCFSVRTK